MDDKGRLKLPVDFIAYLASFGGKKLYITTTDKRIGRVYNESVWRQNVELLRNAPNRQAADRISFTAKANGDAVEIDDAGRALLPVELRKTLKISGKTQVWLDAFDGCVRVLTKEVYEERMRDGDANRAADHVYLDEIRFR